MMLTKYKKEVIKVMGEQGLVCDPEHMIFDVYNDTTNRPYVEVVVGDHELTVFIHEPYEWETETTYTFEYFKTNGVTPIVFDLTAIKIIWNESVSKIINIEKLNDKI